MTGGEPGSDYNVGRTQEKKQRISTLTAMLMIALAIFFDLLQIAGSFFIPLLGLGLVICWAVSFISFVTFGLWFAFQGVNPGDKNFAVRMLIYMSSVIVELTPFIDALPAITLGVIALIVLTRAEDETGLKIKKVGAAQLRSVITNNLPMLKGAQALYNRGRGQVDQDAKAIGVGGPTGAPRVDYAGQLKQRQVAAAMRQDLTGNRFTEPAEHYSRRNQQTPPGKKIVRW